MKGWNGDFRLKRELRRVVELEPFLDRIQQLYEIRKGTAFPSEKDLQRLIKWEDQQFLEAENRSRRSAADYEVSRDNTEDVDVSQLPSKYKLYLVSKFAKNHNLVTV